MHELLRVGVARGEGGRGIAAFVVDVVARRLDDAFDRRRVVGAVEQRPAAVLVAVEHREERMGIRRVVAVHRGIGRRADRDRSVGTVSQQDHRGGQQQRVPHHAAAAVGVPHAPPEQGEERQCEEGDARVDRQAERIDEQYVDHRPDVDRVGDNQSVDEPEDRQRDDRCDAESLEGHGRVFAEIVDVDQCRNGQQIEDVNAIGVVGKVHTVILNGYTLILVKKKR